MHEMPPLVLIASRDEWTTRSLESVLAPAGFAVARAYNAAQLLERARTIRPDAVLIGTDLADETGVSACRRLREQAALPFSTPILLLSPGTVGRAERIEAFEAGAWDLVPFPLEPAEMSARLRLYASAKRDADAARGAADVDAETGVYTLAGLLRRSEELAAFARRMEQPFACVIFEAGTGDGEVAPTVSKPAAEGAAARARTAGPVDLRRVAAVFRDVGRRSDVLGRVDDSHLAVLATDTDSEGARGLARRLSAALEPGEAAAIRAGCWAVADPREVPKDPREIILAATRALK